MNEHDLTHLASRVPEVATMKALTIHQPWASLIMAGVKKYETRPMRMNYRGPLAIHAALKPFEQVFDSWGHVTEAVRKEETIMRLLQTDNLRDLPKGVVLGTVEVVDCGRITLPFEPPAPPYIWNDDLDCYRRTIIGEDERALGNWHDGSYAIKLANPVLFPEPIPARGQQGLWN